MTPADSPRAKWMALGLLAAAQFVVVLDASIVNVALPSIGRDLEFSQDNLSWVVNAYTLFFGGFLLLGGRLAERPAVRHHHQADGCHRAQPGAPRTAAAASTSW